MVISPVVNSKLLRITDIFQYFRVIWFINSSLCWRTAEIWVWCFRVGLSYVWFNGWYYKVFFSVIHISNYLWELIVHYFRFYVYNVYCFLKVVWYLLGIIYLILIVAKNSLVISQYYCLDRYLHKYSALVESVFTSMFKFLF